MGKAEIGESTGIVPCDDDPLELISVLSQVDKGLPVGIGEFGELANVDLIVARLDVALAIPEEFEMCFGDWFAGYRICHKVERLIADRFLDQRRIGEPDDDIAGIAIGHFRFDQIRASFLQRGW